MGGWIDLGGGQAPRAPDIELIQDDAQGCRYRVTIYGFYLDTVQIPQGTFISLTLPGTSLRMEKGNPELPKLEISTIVPDDRDVSCEIANLDVVSFDVLPVIPSKGSLPRTVDPETVPYTFNDIYYTGQWFPNTIEELQEPFFLCDYWGRTVRLNVFRHNPTLGKLEVARQFEVILSYQPPSFAYQDSIASDFLGIYDRFFLNFSPAHYGYARRIRMTIITADEFYNAVMPLRNWKMKKGIIVNEVKRVSEIGANPNAIKQYIFHQWRVYGVSFFLLVGDYNQIPCSKIGIYAADPLYVMLYPENDSYPDAYISRISGNNNQEIVNQIDKLVWYERFAPTSPVNPDWLDNALVMASRQRGDSIPDSTHKNNMRNMLLRKFPQVVKLYDYAAIPDNVLAQLNNGKGFVNFLGHGDREAWHFNVPPVHPVFAIEHVNALTNWDMPPFVISVACDVGDFMRKDTCFAEAWLRRGQHKGAVGFYGSSAPQDWNEPIWADSVAIHSLTYDWLVKKDFPNLLGEALYTGGVEMIRAYPRGSGYYNFVTWHIFGDANLQVRIRPPNGFYVSHPLEGTPGQEFSVYVFYGDTAIRGVPPYPGVPCARAVVCLWKEDDDYNVYQLTGRDGYARFVLPNNLTSGEMFVTVTKWDHGSYEGTAEIVRSLAGNQAGPGEIGNLNLSVTPLVSGSAFTIRVPTYALELEVYDGSGRLVNRFYPKDGLLWRGMDQYDRPLPEGVYFIKASGRGKTEVKKVLLVR
jgi:hypothetical protein